MRRLKPVPLTTRPRVSVVIPCYNYGRFLPDAVTSALDHSGVDVDVLIVDDCSTDDSATVALRLAAEDPRVDVLLHETNRGHIRTYNDGLDKATGDYVVLLSADDVLTTDSLTRAVALMEAHPNVGLVYGRATSFENDLPLATGRWTTWSVWSGAEWLGHVADRARNPIASPEAVMRTSLLRELGGGYDDAHPHAGDMLLWLRAAARSDVGRVNGPVQAGYRRHGSNMHVTEFAGEMTDLAHVRMMFEAFFRDMPDACLRRRALDALSHEAMLLADECQANGGDPESIAEFAAACSPTVRESRRWTRYERRRLHGISRAAVATSRMEHWWRWQVRSRKSWAFGL